MIRFQSTSWRVAMVVVLASLVGACNAAPTLNSISDQQAEVGVELTIEIVAADADGDQLEFRASCSTISDLNSRAHPPAFIPFGSGAYMRWTPLASDAGSHEFTITVSDGKSDVSTTFSLNVIAGNAVPVFRKPLGTGSTLDLSTDTCFEVDVLVEDPDSPEVDIYLEDPIAEGYQFNQDDPMAGTFSWCPTDKQIDQSERWTLNLAADDRAGHIGRKKYVIVLRKELGQNCPGAAPVISHVEPAAMSTILDIAFSAQISDDLGLVGSPVLYYSLTAPADPANPNFDEFVQVVMTRTSGDASSGTYEASVPNPVVHDDPGTMKTIYYFIEAEDNDDVSGTCDHRTRSPELDVYSVAVTRPESGQGVGSCEACGADVQCQSGFCATMGSGTYCLEQCTAPGQVCDSLSTCSQVQWNSVDGLMSLICVPNSGTCQAACTDDAYEENDTADDPNVQDLGDGMYPGLKLCGDEVSGIDEDYYGLLISAPSMVTVSLIFNHDDGDIDLELIDDSDTVLESSDSLNDNEQVTACLDPGLYFIGVYTWDWVIDNSYDLVITIPPGECCTDDSLEENDGALEAMPAQDDDLIDEVKICPEDEDWFQIDLAANDKIVVDVLFDQANFDQDLDVYLYDRDGSTNLTPCCNSQNGQSGTSDEHLEYTVTAAGTYYVVVKGFLDASNDYIIGFDVQPQ